VNVRKITKKDFKSSTILPTLICVLVTVILLPVLSFDNSQKYNEFINGLSWYDVNKSGELELIWGAVFISSITAVLNTLLRKNTNSKVISEVNPKFHLWMLAILTIDLGVLLLSGQIYSKLAVASVYCLLVLTLYPALVEEMILLGICVYYISRGLITGFTVAIQRVKLIFVDQIGINQNTIWIVSAILFSSIMLLWRWKPSKNNIKKAILIMQCVIPINVLQYLKDRYLYDGKLVIIPFRMRYYAFIVCVCMALICFSILTIKRNGIGSEDRSCWSCISLSLIITIFILNSYWAPTRMIPDDLWHNGEQVTEWQQVVTQGQGLYSEFCPSSGNFSYPVGMFMHFLGDGTGTSYNLGIASILMISAVLTIILVYFVGGVKIALLFAVALGMANYNRQLFILPCLFLLTLPNLRNRKNLWLQIWALCMLYEVYYYYTSGGALAIATLPYALVQLILLIKDKENRKEFKKATTWMGWGIVLVILALNVKIVIGMLRYASLLAGMSLLADSLPLLTYTSAPTWFLPFLSSGIRYFLYLATRISFPVVAIVIPSVLFAGVIKIDGKKFIYSDLFLPLTVSVIFPLIYYTFSFNRADTGVIISRTGTPIIIIFEYLIITIYSYGKKYYTKSLINSSLSFMLMVIVFLFAVGNGMSEFILPSSAGVKDDSNFMNISYTYSSDSYTLIDSKTDPVSGIGDGFMKNTNYSVLEQYNEFISLHGMQNESFVNIPRFYYWLLNVKAPYVDNTVLLQNRKSQDSAISYFESVRPIFAPIALGVSDGISPVYNYEIIRWMQDNNYVTLDNAWIIPEEKASEYNLVGNIAANTVNTVINAYGNIPSSFGKSYDVLSDIIPKKLEIDTPTYTVLGGIEDNGNVLNISDPNYSAIQIEFPKIVKGRQYDYIYLEFSVDESMGETGNNNSQTTELMAYYSRNPDIDKHYMNIVWEPGNGDYSSGCVLSTNYGEGKLLIPLGYNSSWRLNDHKGIQLQFVGFNTGTKIKIEHIVLCGRKDGE
jgi:hypothetical protein